MQFKKHHPRYPKNLCWPMGYGGIRVWSDTPEPNQYFSALCNSNTPFEGSAEPKRRGRKRSYPEETAEDRKRRMKEKRKAVNRKYYERNRKPAPKAKAAKAEESDDVRRWKCTLLSRNNGLTPKPLTMSTEDYLDYLTTCSETPLLA